MEQLTRTLAAPGRIDLANEPDVWLGALAIRPSRREVEGLGVSQTLQPRVMQVLVALVRPTSEVVSHDELIRRCWGGLTVGEDAVRRLDVEGPQGVASPPSPWRPWPTPMPSGADRDPKFLFEPAAAPLRRDPRFMELATRFDLPAYWRGAGRWPDACPGARTEHDCAAALAAPAR